jgi:hypothetical protein
MEVCDMWKRTIPAGVLCCVLATGGCGDQILLEGDNLNQPSPLLSLQSVPCPENSFGAESCKVVTNWQTIVNGMLSRLSDTAPAECWSAVWQVMDRGIEGTLYTTTDFLDDQAGDASIGPYDIILNEMYFDGPMTDFSSDVALHEGYHNNGRTHDEYGGSWGMDVHIAGTCYGRSPAPWPEL